MTSTILTHITPCLWYDHEAEEAARFYVSIFPNSRIDRVDRASADYPSGHEGDVITVAFTLDGFPMIGLNGGPAFHFNEAMSFMVECFDQDEVDRYWDALTRDGGEPGPCGWLKDRYGLSWQVVPRQLNELLQSSDRDAARRVMEAMLQMGKIEILDLERAFGGEPVAT
jgi:predicted 3-demethylubiquinone-9 3-methyltransferase (glyoxalase superfamily)